MKTWLAILCLVCGVVAGYSIVSAAEEPIAIGVSIPLTGQFAAYGRDLQESLELARDEINAAGGVQNRLLELVVMDSESDPNISKRIARKLAGDKRIVAEIGDFSSTASMAAQPIYQNAGLVQFSPTSSHPSFTPASPYSFSVSGTSKDQSSVIARMAIDTLHKKKLAVIYLNTDWGVAEQKYFTEEATRLGAEIVAVESYLEGTTDFTAALEKIRAAKPELLYLCSLYQDGALIAKDRQKIGWNDVMVVGAGTLHSPKFVELGGDAVEGIYTSTSFFPENPRQEVQKFVAAYQARYNRVPNVFAAQVYDALYMLAEAIKRGGTERQAIRDELAKTKDFPGVLGKVTFSENRDILKEYLLLQIQQGKFVIYTAQ